MLPLIQHYRTAIVYKFTWFELQGVTLPSSPRGWYLHVPVNWCVPQHCSQIILIICQLVSSDTSGWWEALCEKWPPCQYFMCKINIITMFYFCSLFKRSIQILCIFTWQKSTTWLTNLWRLNVNLCEASWVSTALERWTILILLDMGKSN